MRKKCGLMSRGRLQGSVLFWELDKTAGLSQVLLLI